LLFYPDIHKDKASCDGNVVKSNKDLFSLEPQNGIFKMSWFSIVAAEDTMCWIEATGTLSS
jgi:hypothetical protein